MKRWLWMVVVGFFLFATISLAADSAPPKKTPELLKEGKTIFGQACAACHGANGDGKGPAAVALTPPPADFQKPLKEWSPTKGNPQKIYEAISKGIPDTAMTAWPQYTEQQRWALVYTVMGFSKPAPKKK